MQIDTVAAPNAAPISFWKTSTALVVNWSGIEPLMTEYRHRLMEEMDAEMFSNRYLGTFATN
ncbi:hypothetical protein RPALISO_249 [Ruegeria phage RpAliso]|nr:hypothetical protein RPALISO_249 [Ruegeria phage RpAliso]